MNELLNGAIPGTFDSRRYDRRHLIMSALLMLAEALMCLGYGVGGQAVLPLASWSLLLLFVCLASIALAWWSHNHSPAWLRGRHQVLLLTLWATGCFLLTSFFLSQYRISALMFFFPILLMASFRLSRWALLGVCSFAVLGYMLVLALVLAQRSMVVEPSTEVLQWVIFTVVTYGFVLSGSAVSRSRSRLTSLNRELRLAVAQARDAAIRDELTGLYSRRHILDILQQQKALADDNGYHFVICYLDLDHFKRINDDFGHVVGDEVLKRASYLMQSILREADYCGRLGGEEFVLLLTGLELQAAGQVVLRLCDQLAEEDFSQWLGDRQVTLSAGVAHYRSGEEVTQLLSRADACLYRAKGAGRNCVVLERPDDA